MQGSKGGGGTHQAADACADDAEGQGLGERCSRQEGGRHVCRGHAEEGAGAETGGPAGRASLECEGWWTARCARQLLLSARSRLRARRLRSQPRLCFLAATPTELPCTSQKAGLLGCVAAHGENARPLRSFVVRGLVDSDGSSAEVSAQKAHDGARAATAPRACGARCSAPSNSAERLPER